jgi:hypothetical protein
MLNRPGQMEFLPWRLARICEGQKHHIPAALRAVSLRTKQNPGVERMHHGAIAQQKCKRLGLVALGNIDAEAFGSLQYAALQVGINPCVAIQNPGDGGYTDFCRRCDLAKSKLAIANRNSPLAHSDRSFPLKSEPDGEPFISWPPLCLGQYRASF